MEIQCTILCFLTSVITLEALLDNVALNKDTKQSSIYKEGYSYLANDGNRSQNHLQLVVGGQLCAHLGINKASYWWAVDLGKEYDIRNINIFYRTDCCGPRFTDIYIYVYNPDIATWSKFDKGPSQLCFFHTGQAPSILSVACNFVHGRYVKIFKFYGPDMPSGYDSLTLCEVEIFVAPSSVQGTYCKQTSKEPVLNLETNVKTETIAECAMFCQQMYSCLGFNRAANGTCSLFQTSKQVANVTSNIEYYEKC